ncbi:MAG: YfjI family protein [Desulfitobacteriaceae bacterium]
MATLVEKLIEVQELATKRKESEAKEQAEKLPVRNGIVDKVPIVESEWSEIVPFSDSGNLPVFSLSILPAWLRDFAEFEAEATQTPPDVTGLLMLSVLGVALSKKFEIELRPGWREPLNVWTVSAMPPGSRKSAVFRDLTSPILQWERQERDRLLPEAKRIESEKRITEGRIQKLQSEAIKAKDMTQAELASQEATDLSVKLEQAEEVILPKLLLDDATPESVARIMAEQNGRIGVMSAEGGIFDILNGRYQNGMPNLDVFLKGHAGDFLRVDRVGRESNFIEAPALSLGLSIQPIVLGGLANKQGLRGRGLLARFLFGLPISNVGYRNLMTQPVPNKIRQSYADGIHRLLDIPLPKEPQILSLSTEAEHLFRELEAWIEPRLRPFAELEPIADWASKLAGATARIIGALHVADTAPNCIFPIGPEVTRAVIELAKGYLIPHAMAAFSVMGADEQQERGKKILRWIEQKELKEFTKKQAHNALQGTFKKSEELDSPLRILEERCYIKNIPVPQDGRKHSPKYEVNPAIGSTISTISTITESRESIVDNVEIVETREVPKNDIPDWIKEGVI